jgi:hypothetical protein
MYISLNKFRKQLAALLVAAVLVAAALVVPSISIAQEEGGSGLSISPTRTELSLEPGAADSVTVSLKNITGGAIVAQMFINDFEPDNETGEPTLVTNTDRKSAASISAFVTGLEDVALEPGETKSVSVDVAIPNEAAPGGYYGALRFKAVPISAISNNGAGNEVSLTANLLSLVLIEVPGDIVQKVAVNSARALLDNKSGSIFTKKPDQIGVQIDNLGNSFVKPFGRVVVKNYSGDQVFTYELNDANPRSNVLPESSRTFKERLVNVERKTVNGEEVQEQFSPITAPGRYTIEANISYGNGGDVFSVTSSFWYIPSWLIIALALVLLVLIGGAFIMYRKYSTRTTRRR